MGECKNCGSPDHDFCGKVISPEEAIQRLKKENAELREQVAELKAERDKLKQEAQIHAQEARTHKATVHEIYQVVSGAKGEPGNWNGAKPVIDRIAELQARLDAHEAATNAVEKVDLAGAKETRLAVARIVSLLTWNPGRDITQDEIRWALTVNENDSLYKTIKSELDEIRGKVEEKK